MQARERSKRRNWKKGGKRLERGHRRELRRKLDIDT